MSSWESIFIVKWVIFVKYSPTNNDTSAFIMFMLSGDQDKVKVRNGTEKH